MENGFHNALCMINSKMISSEIKPFSNGQFKHKNAVKINGWTIFREKWATQQNNFTAIVSHLAYILWQNPSLSIACFAVPHEKQHINIARSREEKKTNSFRKENNKKHLKTAIYEDK